MKTGIYKRMETSIPSAPLVQTGSFVLADSLKTQMAAIIKEMIFNGQLKPGDALRELHLARKFQVSQATVREALLELEQHGLAVRLANRSTTVTRLSPGEVRDRLEIRSQLEPLACIRAAGHLQGDDFRYLGRLATKISRDHRSPNYSFYETSLTDYQFHRYLWQKSGSTILCATLEQVTLPLFAFIGLLRQAGLEERRPSDTHKPILEALRSGEADPITHAVRQHFKNSYNHFLESESENLQTLLAGQSG